MSGSDPDSDLEWIDRNVRLPSDLFKLSDRFLNPEVVSETVQTRDQATGTSASEPVYYRPPSNLVGLRNQGTDNPLPSLASVILGSISDLSDEPLLPVDSDEESADTDTVFETADSPQPGPAGRYFSDSIFADILGDTERADNRLGGELSFGWSLNPDSLRDTTAPSVNMAAAEGVGETIENLGQDDTRGRLLNQMQRINASGMLEQSQVLNLNQGGNGPEQRVPLDINVLVNAAGQGGGDEGAGARIRDQQQRPGVARCHWWW